MQDSAYVQGRSDEHEAMAFHAYPLAQLAAAFALGVLSNHFLAVPLSLLVAIAAITTVLAFMALLWLLRLRLATLLVTTTALFLGASLAAIEKDRLRT